MRTSADQLPGVRVSEASPKRVKRSCRQCKNLSAKASLCPPEQCALPEDSGWPPLKTWLEETGAVFGGVSICNCSEGEPGCQFAGLGAFANRDFTAGDVIFSIPQSIMITRSAAIEDPSVLALSKLLASWGEDDTWELLVCMRLCRARVLPEDRFHVYALSLPVTPPGVGSWPIAYRNIFAATAVQAALIASEKQLDRWESLLNRAAETDPVTFVPSEALRRPCLEWALGMVRSRHFPGSFGDGVANASGCMVPLLDILNHRDGQPVTVRIRGGMLEFVCEGVLTKGEQIWNNYGSKSNEELLVCYGFAVENNPADCVALPLAPSSRAPDSLANRVLQLTPDGMPQELIESLDSDRTHGALHFVSLLRALGSNRQVTLQGLQRVASRLKRTSPARAKVRWKLVQAFFEGQLMVLERCLEQLHTMATRSRG